MFEEYSHIPSKTILHLIKTFGKTSVFPLVETVIDGIRQEILNRKLVIKPIIYRKKIDPSSKKERDTGIQDVKQQILDYIAVEGLRPLFCRIGEFQCASIKNRGQIMGVSQIKRWMRNINIRYAGKLDIRKCYESINRKKLMHFLEIHVKNETLLWIINELINTFKQGLSIGSYLSQFLCNLYMSQLYHQISEHMYRIRKHKKGTVERINLVDHVIFFMDDILILGTNIKDIHKAIKLIISYAKEEMGLEVKENWIAFKTKLSDKKNDSGQFIDMMGYRIYRWHVTIRRRVFKKIRRLYIRIYKWLKTHKYIPISQARRCISYNGEIKNSDSFKFKKKYHANDVFRICKKVVKNYDKSKIYNRTATC